MREYPHLRRNFFLFWLDYVAFGVAFSLMGSSGAVVPSFISQLTDSKQIIGLAGSFYLFSWLVPQLFLAQIVNRRTRRQPFIRPAVVIRPIIIVMAMLITASGLNNPNTTLIVFLVAYWLFAAGDSIVTLAWGDMLGSSIPSRLRGVMFGMGQMGVAIGALAARELARWALGPDGPVFPHNYALIFGVAGIIFVIGGAGLALTVEEKSQIPVEPGPRAREYIPYLGNVLRYDRDFQKFIRTRLLFDLARMAVPFYIVLGVSVLGLHKENAVGDSILLIEAGNAASSFAMAWLSRRSGSRAVIVLVGIIAILEPAMALLSFLGGGQTALYATFFLLGMFSALAVPSYFDWMITHAPSNRRPIYIGLTNTISALSNLAPFLGGTLLQMTAIPVLAGAALILPSFLKVTSGHFTVYPVVFVAAMALAFVGFLSALGLSEPRKRDVEQAQPAPLVPAAEGTSPVAE